MARPNAFGPERGFGFQIQSVGLVVAGVGLWWLVSLASCHGLGGGRGEAGVGVAAVVGTSFVVLVVALAAPGGCGGRGPVGVGTVSRRAGLDVSAQECVLWLRWCPGKGSDMGRGGDPPPPPPVWHTERDYDRHPRLVTLALDPLTSWKCPTLYSYSFWQSRTTASGPALCSASWKRSGDRWRAVSCRWESVGRGCGGIQEGTGYGGDPGWGGNMNEKKCLSAPPTATPYGEKGQKQSPRHPSPHPHGRRFKFGMIRDFRYPPPLHQV